MELIRNIDQLKSVCSAGVALCIGMFDGLHRGHQWLIGQAIQRASELQIKALAITFANHPLSLLAPPFAPQLLSDSEEKTEWLAQLGLDICALFEFNPAFATISALDFLEEILVRQCQMRFLVCGPDFRFGAQGKGDVALLSSRAPELGFELTICDALLDQESGLPIRSTRIRQALLEGRVSEAGRLLGRHYQLRGVVKRGDQRGRTIGYPTANLEIPPTRLVPQNGVYAIHARLGDELHHAMLNIGHRPTFGLQQRTIEAHLFDFSRVLYDEALTLQFIARIRDEQKFKSPADLIEQLRQDETICRTILR